MRPHPSMTRPPRHPTTRHPVLSVCAGLLVLASVLIAAPADADEASGRAAMTGRLVPITGEAQRSVDLTVPFARGSAELAAEAERPLTELAHALAGERLRDLEVGIYGHTDASGSAVYNQTLSEARAAAVVRYLTERFGLDAARFRHAGHGEDRLLEGVAPNSPRHRRVEIVVFAPKRGPAAEPDDGQNVEHTDTKVENDDDDGSGTPGGTGLQAID